MGKKNVEDYLMEGIYGSKQTKRAERKQFLGTIRERIVIALTKGQVMTDKGLEKLDEAMEINNDAKLLINGHVSSKFLKEEKALAKKHNIAYTVITNNDADTDIGAVLTYDYAIDKEDIFVQNTEEKDEPEKPASFFSRVKRWFT
ncbi:YueI family protein [Virgibacillus sp. JSM 102003]|uniref:YueI family protein n=1 Tax=Virgibacillus sp. JSM 102003 TaxID=1562108 RepID=UPI0035C21D4E